MAASRHLNKLRETLGREAGEDLMTWLEEERTQRQRLDSRFDAWQSELVGLRQDMQLGFTRVDASLERALRKQTQFFFLAWAVNVAAIVGLYAR